MATAGIKVFGRRLGPRHGAAAAAVLVLGLVLAAWTVRVPPGETPVLRIAGSGFLFNYRTAEATYGFTAVLMKPVRNASVIEATFEDPGGGASIRTETKLWAATRQYGIQSPNVFDIRAHRPYRVEVRLLEGPERTPAFATTLAIASDLDDAVMPRAPTTIGPGYAPNPTVPLEANRRG